MMRLIITTAVALVVACSGVRAFQAGGPGDSKDGDLPSVARKMSSIKDRLEKGLGGEQTQKLQKEVVAGLDQRIKELGPDKKTDSMFIGPGEQLKMLRAMQVRVNTKTALYAKQYKGEGVPSDESAEGPEQREQFETIRRELKELAKQQEKIAGFIGSFPKPNK
jgi:hypothetical protein